MREIHAINRKANMSEQDIRRIANSLANLEHYLQRIAHALERLASK